MYLQNKVHKIWKLIKNIPFEHPFAEQDLIFNLFSGLNDKKPDERIMIDVGAQYGSSFFRFARSGWTVYCFEPDDDNRSILLKNIKKQRFNKVFVDERAVSNLESKANYYKSEISSGISSIIKFHASHKVAKEVEITTLSAFCKKENITFIDFLKIDTEGNDLRVIEGLDIINHKPSAIICEFEDAKTKLVGYSKKDISNFLLANGYKFIISEWYPIVQYGKHHEWKKFTDDISMTDDNSWGNIIAVKPELFELLIRINYKIFRNSRNLLNISNS
jgi:FkbM family methyltransferase